MIEPLHNNILAELVKEETKIEVVGSDGPSKKASLRVIAVGPGRYDINGNLVPMSVSRGDLVKIKDQMVWGVEDPTTDNKRELFIFSDEQVLCRIIDNKKIN